MGESRIHSEALNREDAIGLVAAVVLHALLIAAIAAQVLLTSNSQPIPNRMTVSLATEVSLESTAPDPVQESRAAAPEAAPEEAEPLIEDTPAVTPPPETTPPPPPPRANTRTAPRPQPTQTPPAPRPTQAPRPSRLDGDFLGGAGESTQTDDTRIPADQIGRREQARIAQAISRQLKPHWDAPSGLDAEQLVTVLAFRLNEDGSLAGRPRLVQQLGVTPSNRPQAPLHVERAIRAVQRAAPFDLPDQYYNAWKNISGARFDRNLSQ